MAKKIEVQSGENGVADNPFKYSKKLEEGNILFFENIPFLFPQEEIEFLLQQRQKGSSNRKNIAYKPQRDQITNHHSINAEETKRLHQVLRRYSESVSTFLKQLLPSYAAAWQIDYTSFRPHQEKGRNLRPRARNDLLHVDAFPTRPMHGKRILRFFTNINPVESRRWLTSLSFSQLVKEFGGKNVALPRPVGFSLKERFARKLKQWVRKAGVKMALRSPYDQFMLEMHNFLKENKQFQESCPKDAWDFPPGSCWAVFTDQVSHAALSGQFALEQTFLVPVQALVYPEEAPLSILERLAGKSLVDRALAGEASCLM